MVERNHLRFVQGVNDKCINSETINMLVAKTRKKPEEDSPIIRINQNIKLHD
jgi:hypothetical protein